jgi:hypothetical protein
MLEAKPKDMSFFRELVWPGAAFSALGGLLMLAIDPHYVHVDDPVDRMLVLGCLTLYLSFDWWVSDWNVNMTVPRFAGNLAHILSIMVFAIGMATGRSELWLWNSLMIVFGTSIVGNMTGVWDPPKPLNFRQRVWQAWPNFLGPIALLGLNKYFDKYSFDHLSIAVILVVVVWVILQVCNVSRPRCFN